jgi:hypothetical protein
MGTAQRGERRVRGGGGAGALTAAPLAVASPTPAWGCLRSHAFPPFRAHSPTASHAADLHRCSLRSCARAEYPGVPWSTLEYPGVRRDLHRCSCALAPARPSAARDVPDRPLPLAPPSVHATVLRCRFGEGGTNPFRRHAHMTRMRCECTFPAHSADRNLTGVASQAKPLLAANLEVRVPVPLRFSARRCARWVAGGTDWGAKQ